MVKRLASLVFFVCLSLPFYGQILINEVSSANVNTIFDEDGDAEDWIEIYNNSPTVIDLKDYYFSCFDGETKVWKFPSILIKPYAHMLIYASDKDRKTVLDHWEVPVYYNFPWKYFVGTSEPDTNWKKPTFNDAAWLTGQGGIGYGDGDDSTIIPNTISLYMRMAFNIADTSKISAALCLLDFDDGFVCYLNGLELMRYNVGIQGTPPLYNETAYDEYEAQLYQTGNYSGGFIVPKSTMSAAMVPGTNVFSIQTHNVDFFSNDMSCIVNFLTGKSDTTIDYFPIPASSNLHTNFTLSSTGFTLSLHDPNGNILDMRSVETMQTDHSRGRKTDAAPDWVIFATPTPGDTNSTSAWYTGYAGNVSISLPPGFYTGSPSTSITSSGGTIRYSLDGSTPTPLSAFYTAPVSIDSTLVLRARLFSNDPQVLPGITQTNTYFINEDITLPVVSISTTPANLWDWNTGIYVMGPNADTAFPYYGANFWQGWEKPGHTEYFDKNGIQGFELDNVLKIHGNWSKGFPQRSFRVLANDDYGSSRIDYNLFPEKNLKELRAFNIRNAGIDWNTTHMRDGLMHRAVRNTFNDIMDHNSCVVFVNGDYFGVFELRERQDEYYIEENHGVDKDEIDLLRFHGDVMEGSNEHFLSMVDFIRFSDMTIPANYDTVKNYLLDIQNITDYFAAEIYYSNPDWLGNNIKFWRKTNPPSPWRYILWDTDGGLGLFSNVADNLLPFVTNSDTTSMYFPNPHAYIMGSMFRNLNFRNYFINRYADLMNTTFHPNNLGGLAQSMYNTMAPEMTRHFNLWGNPTTNPYGFGACQDSTEWAGEFQLLMDFIYDRPQYARQWVQNEWNLPNQVSVVLDVQPAGAGKILMNTIYPDSFPWAGVYYNGVPVTMTATAFNGYKFSHWESSIQLPDPVYTGVLTINVPASELFTAYYVPIDKNMNVYPNPSDHEFNVLIQVPENGQVEVAVFDILGRKAGELMSGDQITPAGEYRFSFFPSQWSLTSGIYFIKMTNGTFVETTKIIYTDKN